MPWKALDTMSLRHEFVVLALQPGSNLRALCRRYQISPRTAYKWLARYRQAGEAGLADQCKRPRHSPTRTRAELEAAVLALRAETGWGGRKIARVLRDRDWEAVPHPNTITAILRRHGQLDPLLQTQHTPPQRFARAAPNELWQLDFKGHFAILSGRCHPLTVLDDHSRFCVGLRACGDETGATTQAELQRIFRQYGLPQAILCDNGGPWGSGYPELELTQLSVWLIRLGITPLHGHPYHPQTQGKDERFHRTLNVELLQHRIFRDLADCQDQFDPWRERYNLLRPHEALNQDPPVQHYQPSPLGFPERLPPVEYDAQTVVRKVQCNGVISYRNQEYRVGKGLVGEVVALRPTETDGVWAVYYAHYPVRQIDLAHPRP